MKETPFMRMLRAYGVDLMRIPEDTAVTVMRGHDGIFVKTFCLDQDGQVAIDDRNSTIVTRNVFHPHP